MPGVRKSIDINAPPEVVREKFLDFAQIPKYSPNGFFKSINLANPDKALEPGDKLNVETQGMNFSPVFVESTPERFRWLGSLPGVFTGEHNFEFKKSDSIPGGTTFTQWEEFTGVLSFLMGESYVANWVGMREESETGWEQYNQDLKKWCEESQT